jgi:hypothetical protein
MPHARFAEAPRRLADLGYVDCRNIIIEPRLAEGQYKRVPELARTDSERHLSSDHREGKVAGLAAATSRSRAWRTVRGSGPASAGLRTPAQNVLHPISKEALDRVQRGQSALILHRIMQQSGVGSLDRSQSRSTGIRR